MRRFLVVLACVAFLGAPAAAAAPRPAVVTQPDWLRPPTAESLAQHFPPLAALLEITGRATISCEVDASGAVVNCKAIEERPKDLGFGQAAIDMSHDFLMRPQTVNGKPVGGATVRIPIRFSLPGSAAAGVQPPAASSTEAMRQALRVTDHTRVVALSIDVYDAGALKAETTPMTGATEGTRVAAAKALREAARGRRDDLRDAYARAVASVFSEAEMAAIADFGDAVGHVFDDSPALKTGVDAIRADYPRAVAAASRAAFCATRVCAAPALRPGGDRESGRIEDPRWAVKPDKTAIEAARPAIGRLLGVEATVRMTCRLDRGGDVRRCGVDGEWPAGLGYGIAAQALAERYRLDPEQLGGGGRKVALEVVFPGDATEASYKPPIGAASVIGHARQIIRDDESFQGERRNIEVKLLEYRQPRGADPKVYEAALSAYRTGAASALDGYMEQTANLWASVFTEAQLKALATYRESATGKVQIERASTLGVAMQNALAYVAPMISGDARQAFCKGRDCLVAPLQSTAASPEPSTRNP